MSWRLQVLAAGLMMLSSLAGCQIVGDAAHDSKSPLRPVKLPSDGVALQVVHTRFAYGDPELNGPFWKEVDESQLSPELRQRLARNAVRAGVISGAMPPALEHLVFDFDSQAVSPDVAAAAKLAGDAPVTRHDLQLRPGGENHFAASSTYSKIDLFWTDEEGSVSGEDYNDAQCILVVKAYPQGDGRVRLKITPEVQHGALKQQFVPDPGLTGQIRPQARKEKHVFEKLEMEVTVARGQMLVLGCHPDRPASVGHYFFTDDVGGKQRQKLLVFRLADTKWDDLFARHTRPVASAPAEDDASATAQRSEKEKQ